MKPSFKEYLLSSLIGAWIIIKVTCAVIAVSAIIALAIIGLDILFK